MFVCAGAQSPEFDLYSKDLRALTLKLGLKGRVKWVGEVNDVVGIMNASDLITVTSIMGEGFPNVIIEAMSCGTPCISTDVGDSNQLIHNPDWSGNVNDENQLSSVFHHVDSDPSLTNLI